MRSTHLIFYALNDTHNSIHIIELTNQITAHTSCITMYRAWRLRALRFLLTHSERQPECCTKQYWSRPHCCVLLLLTHDERESERCPTRSICLPVVCGLYTTRSIVDRRNKIWEHDDMNERDAPAHDNVNNSSEYFNGK